MDKRTYRADIDGLRAVAVLAVIAYHAGIPLLVGGFMGVDIFFVISGFLITQILLREIDSGTFNFSSFYVRRIRRIVPAFLVVSGLTAVAATLIMPPFEFARFGQSLAAAAFGVSNMLFLLQLDYFAGTADSIALLHTWSLGVEEQFYVLFPIVLLLLFNLRKTRKLKPWLNKNALPILLVSGWVVSFLLNIIATYMLAKVAFFMLPTRAWELLTGAILAAGLLPEIRRTWLVYTLDILGLLCIVVAFFLIDNEKAFPGFYALVPCLGAGLLIYAGQGRGQLGLSGKVLRWPPIVAVGLISYSAYLIHWPALVLARFAHPGPLPATWIAAVLVVVTMLSIASWKWVEQPFRNPNWGTGKGVLYAGVAILGLWASIGLMIVLFHGFPQRLPIQAQTLAWGSEDHSPYRSTCNPRHFVWEKACHLGTPGISPSLVVWGDSHAIELSAALGELANIQGTTIIEATYTQCPPAQDFAIRKSPHCPEFNRAVLAGVLANDAPKVLLVESFFNNIYLAPEYYPAFAKGMEETVRRLRGAGKQVYMLAPVPYVDFIVPRDMAISVWWNGGKLLHGHTLSKYMQMTARGRELLETLAKRYGAILIYPNDALCKQGQCQLVDGEGRSLYSDAHHLSMTGARWLVNHTPQLGKLVLRMDGQHDYAE